MFGQTTVKYVILVARGNDLVVIGSFDSVAEANHYQTTQEPSALKVVRFYEAH